MFRSMTLVLACIALLFVCTSCAPSNPLPGTWYSSDGNFEMTNTASEISISAPKLAPLMNQMSPELNQLAQGLAPGAPAMNFGDVAAKGMKLYYKIKNKNTIDIYMTGDLTGTPTDSAQYKMDGKKLIITGGMFFSMSPYQNWTQTKP